MIYIYIWGVPRWGCQGSKEVAGFLAKQLRLPKPLYLWKKRNLAYLKKRCGHHSGEAGVDCEPSPRNIQAQHQPLATQETASPVALSHGKPGAASILFSQSAISNGEGAILCENTSGGSEHSTDPVVPPVMSSNRRYKRRFAPNQVQ